MNPSGYKSSPGLHYVQSVWSVAVAKSNEDMILALVAQFKQLSHEPEKLSGDSTGFETMTSAKPVQCSNQLSYEVTELGAGQFVGRFPVKGISYERNVI